MILHSFASSQGRRRTLDDLDAVAPDVLALLRRFGFRSYVESDKGALAMALEAAEGVLSSGRVDRADVEAFLILSESFDEAHDSGSKRSHLHFRDALLRGLIDEAGLHRARPFASWTSACGNLGPGLAIARGLLATGSADNLLLVASDRLPVGESRVLQNGTAVYSDVATGCMASRSGVGLKVVDVLLNTRVGILRSRDAGNFLARGLELKRGLDELNAGLKASTGREFRDFEVVLFENFGPMLVKYCCESMRVPASAVSWPTIGDYAHTFSGDLLLSLGRLAQAGGLPRGTGIAAVSISSPVLAALALEAT